jgi:putative transposase
LDGAKGLRAAVKSVFGKSFPVQRCVRQKERNIISYLPRENHMEFRRRWKKLHGLVDYSEAKREHQRLIHWLSGISQAAVSSLDEAMEETLSVIRLKAGNLLIKTLSSTNPIESAFDKVRNNTRRVKRWRRNTDQVSRWAASGLVEAEAGFRTIKGFRQIKAFIQELLLKVKSI